MRALGRDRARPSGADALGVRGEVLIPGEARGPLLRLRSPISFWGGIDPATGRVADPRHPDFGVETTGTVLCVPETVGSSSSSAILLDLLRIGRAPAALVLGHADAILTLGVVVAREMGYPTIPVVEIPPSRMDAFRPGRTVRVRADGTVEGA
jgi:predicted aconitase with swiveling domain